MSAVRPKRHYPRLKVSVDRFIIGRMIVLSEYAVPLVVVLLMMLHPNQVLEPPANPARFRLLKAICPQTIKPLKNQLSPAIPMPEVKCEMNQKCLRLVVSTTDAWQLTPIQTPHKAGSAPDRRG